ncbi:hypothetical protein FIV08_04100 [Marinobacter sp. THAF197a]|nr:hypothetical protein FIV08_04100 [Marinobacter sp. THAF197a]
MGYTVCINPTIKLIGVSRHGGKNQQKKKKKVIH